MDTIALLSFVGIVACAVYALVQWNRTEKEYRESNALWEHSLQDCKWKAQQETQALESQIVLLGGTVYRDRYGRATYVGPTEEYKF